MAGLSRLSAPVGASLSLALALAVALIAGAGPTWAADAKPLCVDTSRACYLKTAHAYFDAFAKADGSATPFADDLRVTEQGEVVATSRAAFLEQMKTTGASKALRNMRMLVDRDTGQVVVMAAADFHPANGPTVTVRRIQRMKIDHGLIKEVELFVYIDPNPGSLWPDE